MIRPRLYEAGTLTFDNNGLGSLIDAKECLVKQGFGSMELEMQYPVKGRLFQELSYQRIILAKPEPTKDPQPFYIYRINTPMGGVAKVYAKQVCYKLDGCPVRPFNAFTAPEAMEKLKSSAMTEHPFEFETDVRSEGSFALKTPADTWKVLGGQNGSILDVFKGEYEFDGYTVRLLTRRGADRGVKISYGKNLQTLEQDANCAGCYTGIVPYWVDTQTGDAVYAEAVAAEGNFGYSRVLSVDFTSEFETKPSLEQLAEKAAQYIKDNNIGVPDVSLKVKFVPLEQTEELKHLALLERVEFGDTVHVYFPELAIDVASRIVETTYDCLRGRYKEVTIGKPKHVLADVIVNQQKQIEKIPQGTAIQIAMMQATQAITGARGGAARLLDTDGDGMADTIYVADHADPGQAKHVWRFNWGGWGYSENGYEGPFTMAATIAGGFVADFITAGTLNSERINGKTLVIEDGAVISTWKVDENSIYENEGYWPQGTFMCTGSKGAYSIGGSPDIPNWVFGAGGKFGVTREGAAWLSAINATKGKIGGWRIANEALTSADTDEYDQVSNAVYLMPDRLFYMYSQAAGYGIFANWEDVVKAGAAAGQGLTTTITVGGVDYHFKNGILVHPSAVE